MVDQYRIKADKRSGIVSNPNRPDNADYILNLIGRVITVSLATVDLVAQIGAEDLG